MKLYIIKIGGNIIDNQARLEAFLAQFAALEGHKILVHGGGKLSTQLAAQLQVPQIMVEGRRITDAETLKIVVMVYGGLINKQIVARLQSLDCQAIGICGADGDVIRASKRQHPSIDYGFVGDVERVNSGLLGKWLQEGIVPVVAPLTHDGKGQLLNTNADTIAQEIAQAMSGQYEVDLIYSFEKSGVLLDVNDENSCIKHLDAAYYHSLKAEKKITDGMLPKLDNAFFALEKGVKRVVIGQAERLQELVTGAAGSSIGL